MNRILVIDDDRPTRMQVSALLKLEGYEVDEAENGSKGVAKAHEQKPDLIVCDIMMPELDGYGTLLKMREHPDTQMIPFIFLTAKSQLGDLRRGMELGADDYLTKPLDPPSLMNAVSQRLERRRIHDLNAERQREELSLSMASALPRELEDSIERLASVSNAIALKHLDDDPQLLKMRDAILNETIYIRRCLRRLDLYGKMPQLYKERFKQLQEVGEPPSESKRIEEYAMAVAKRFSREDDLVSDLKGSVVSVPSEYIDVIVDELVTNAFQYSPDDSKIVVSGIASPGVYTILVQNEGDGVSEELLGGLLDFSSFGRLEHKRSGVGIGLPLVNGLARLHGGELSLESSPGSGFLASVFVPCKSLTETPA